MQHSLLWRLVYGAAMAFHYMAATVDVMRQASVDVTTEPRSPQLRQWAPDDVRMVRMLALKDKLSFVIGVGTVMTTSWALGAAPDQFFWVYSVEVTVAILYRLYRYRLVKQHYYLLDFCYWANALMLYYIWFDRGNYMLFQALWLFAVGPLAWSVMTFRNSLVFHASDKVTSVIVHLLPSWVCWSIRWYARPESGFRYCRYALDAHGSGGHCEAGLRDMYLVRVRAPCSCRLDGRARGWRRRAYRRRGHASRVLDRVVGTYSGRQRHTSSG